MGQGSRFEVVLPTTTSPGEATMPPRRRETPAVARRVLVVDDSRDSAEALSIILEQSGHVVSTAFGAHEAIAQARAFRPEVVFLDIGLPEMDGYELARRLRAIPETAKAKLLALTGYGQANDRQQALDAGFDEHLVKPFDPEMLSRVIG
jgi:two-component system CheB/CheR fusion protein